jgi:hypothetical protein
MLIAIFFLRSIYDDIDQLLQQAPQEIVGTYVGYQQTSQRPLEFKG